MNDYIIRFRRSDGTVDSQIMIEMESADEAVHYFLRSRSKTSPPIIISVSVLVLEREKK